MVSQKNIFGALCGPGNIHLRSELKDIKIIGVEEHVTFQTS